MAKSAKKPKEKNPSEESNAIMVPNSKSNPSTSEDPDLTISKSNSSVFSSLFGVIPEENSAGLSIFSDSNPFRRKPGNPSSEKTVDDRNGHTGFAVENPNGEEGGILENSDGSAELKRRKRKQERKRDDEGKEDEDEGRKDLKRVRRNGRETGQEKEADGVTADSVDNAINEEKKGKKKKRKRDEVEAEYEANRYGAVEEEPRKEKGGGIVGVKRKEMDNLEDVMVSREGFDDESKLLRTVFVGNLPLKIKKKVLIKEFAMFGEVESLRIRSIPLSDSKVPRKGAIMKKQINETADSVHAYVVFKTEESAQASLAHNMAVVGGNHIRVDRACPPRKKLKGDNTPLYDNKRTVFVGNLPFDVKDEELYQLFSGIKDLESSIEAIRIVRDPGTSLGKGIAYVLFKTRAAANMVVKRRHLKIRDRDLRLYHAKAETTPSKRKGPLSTTTPSAKKFGGSSRFASPENKTNSKAALSYQGLRASKSGIQKKTHRPEKATANTQKVPMQKERLQKRPAVAARKAKVLKSKQAGFKRKPDKQTPDSNRQNKKARRFT